MLSSIPPPIPLSSGPTSSRSSSNKIAPPLPARPKPSTTLTKPPPLPPRATTMSAQNSQSNALTQEQLDHFLQHGWLKLSNCFSQAQADEMTANLWSRLNMSPTDKTTWTQGRVHMPNHRSFPVSEFAPKAWSAICELVGGEDRIHAETQDWKDSLIVNLGTPESEGKVVPPWKEFNWHVDGDFFVHYLNSPEQGLLVIPLFSRIRSGGGATWICPSAIGPVARYLAENPDGVSPRMTPRAENPTFDQSWEKEKGLDWFNGLAQRFAKEAGDDAHSKFVEATGEVGDVYLLHPLMLHSASSNRLREVRLITNPPVSLKTEMRFDDRDGYVLSPVEQKTAREVGEKAKDWRRTADRQSIIPERVRIQMRMKEEEAKRLKAGNVKVEAVSVEA